MRIAVRFFTLIGVFCLALSLFSSSVVAQTIEPDEFVVQDEVIVHFFEDRLCPVCHEQKIFLQEIEKERDYLEIYVYSISDTKALRRIGEKIGVADIPIMAPTTIIGSEVYQFYEFGSRQQEQIIAAIDGRPTDSDESIITIPLINKEVDYSAWALPLLAITLGFIDGLNVCSLGALILILSIVIRLESRRKIFLYGGVFILAATLIYGLLVFFWGQLFAALVGNLEILRYIVGLAALAGGIVFFRDFVKFARYGPACETGSSKLKSRVTKRMLNVLKMEKATTWLVLSTIVVFAAVITLIELPCSIGLPITFTGILAEQGVSIWAYTGYVGLYLVMYMLNEFAVFTGAVMTKRLWFSGSRLITTVTLIGSLVLFYLAYHYLLG